MGDKAGQDDFSRLERIDDACVRFERQWQAGGVPHMEDFLKGAEGDESLLLLRELVAVDLHYRRASGERPAQSDYLSRFPEGLDAITSAFCVRDSRANAAPRRGEDGWPSVPGFRILERLGAGGMGVVYKAELMSPRRVVAMKFARLSGAGAEESRRRFRREVDALMGLRHPNVVGFYEWGEAGGELYYAMEYADGGSLDRLLRQGPLPPREAAALAEAVARALHESHKLGIVHRDIKPSNVLLSSGPGEAVAAAGGRGVRPVPKVADFGLAKQAGDAGLTASGQAVGTEGYMAPEQARGAKHVGPEADIYSIGAVLYRCLTGASHRREAPAEGSGTDAPGTMFRREGMKQDVPPGLQAVCLKCLEHRPERRYATAAALADDLRRYLREEQPAVVPMREGVDGAWGRYGFFVVLASVVALCVLAVAGCLASIR